MQLRVYILILKVNKCFLSALYDEMQLKMYEFRERKRWRTVNLGNSEGMPMFLYYHHTMNQSIVIVLIVLLRQTL